MQSSRLITLFSDPPPTSTGPSAFVVSFVLHNVLLVLLYLGFKHVPMVYRMTLAQQKYTVRLVSLRSSKPQTQESQKGPVAQTGRHVDALSISPGGGPAVPDVPQLVAQKIPAPQTLIQPDLPPNLLAPKAIPIPQVLMWTAESNPVKVIVPPVPQQNASANVQPTLSPPNHELVPAEITMSASNFATEMPALPPSTTSPIAVHGPQPVQLVPETTSTLLAQPTPARVMSLSNLRLAEGTIALPAVNETSQSSSSGSLTPGMSKGQSQAGNGNPASTQNGVGIGKNAGDQSGKTSAASSGIGLQDANNGSNLAEDVNSGSGNELVAHHITLPKDGKFNVVVVGSSLAEEYPETSGLWSGRLAYTVFLHLGAAKSWILQYAVPREAQATVAGDPIRPDAPWPYDIMRPDIDPDADTDAVMIHGFVNAAGHFEKLAVVYPDELAEKKFLIGSLEQWQFRPAMQNGQATRVEVLLIIPGPEE